MDAHIALEPEPRDIDFDMTITEDEILTWLASDIYTIVAHLFWSPQWPDAEEAAVVTEADEIAALTARGLRLSEWEARARLGACPFEEREDRVRKLVAQSEEAARAYIDGYMSPRVPERPTPQIARMEWQRPVTPDGTTFLGFVDLVVEWLNPRLRLAGYTYADRWAPTLNERRRAPDPYLMRVDLGDWERRTACFLVKTAPVPTAALIREVRVFEQFVKGDWVIVTPDAARADLLAEQKIFCCAYPPLPPRQRPPVYRPAGW